MTVLIKRKNGDIEEVDGDPIIQDGEGVRVPLVLMDDNDKLAAQERVKEAAYEKYKQRTANAWKGNNNTPPKGAEQLPAESYIGAGQRILIAKQ